MWLYKNREVKEIPEGYIGFIYLITGKDTLPEELRDKIYIGKKAFTHSVKSRISKKQIKLTKTRKRVQRTAKDSGWQNYFGSSKQLLIDIQNYGKQNFIREILYFCKTKAELTFYEAKFQFEYDILRVNSWNGWILCRVYKSKLMN